MSNHTLHPRTIKYSNTSQSMKKEPLTNQEIKILRLIAQGLTDKAIANKLYLADGTIRTHRSNIRKKLDAKNTAEAVAIGIKSGLI